MLQQKMFAGAGDMTKEGIEQALAANAEKVEQGYVFTRQLSKDDLDEMREVYAQERIEVTRMAKEAAEVAKEYKAKIDKMNTVAANRLNTIRDRYEEVADTVFLFPDEESSMIGYYDKRGELVYSRRMTPEEREQYVAQPNNLRAAM